MLGVAAELSCCKVKFEYNEHIGLDRDEDEAGKAVFEMEEEKGKYEYGENDTKHVDIWLESPRRYIPTSRMSPNHVYSAEY